jgi:benzylsuccinate CoA-transferase BbsF subunit
MAFRSPAPRLGEHQDAVIASTKRRDVEPALAGDAIPPRGPLSGIRVLDFTHVLAGPTATQALAFLGAEIIKVETRNAGLEQREAAYAGLNRGKKGVTLDARSPGGKELALQLAAQCDVVIDNFSAGVMAKLGLAYDDLKAVKPDIIAVSINGWGRGGPLSSWSAYGPTLQSYTGMYWTWRHEGAPFYQGVKQPPADFICAAQALLGMVAALTHREGTGAGQFVELVMLEGLGHSLGPYYLDAVLGGQGEHLHGHRTARWAPNGRYRCKGDDAWCDIACETDAEWEGLKRAMGRPEWASSPAFATRDARLAASADLDRHIGDWAAGHRPADLMRLLQREGVRAGAIQNAEDVFNDPHLRARGHIVTTPNPAGGAPLEVEGMTARFSGSVCHDDSPAPQIGEHNAAVFGGLLGLTAEKIKELEEAKVIY